MLKNKQIRMISSFLLAHILLICLPVCAFAEDSKLSDKDEVGVLLSTLVPPSILSGADVAYIKGGATGLTFTTDDARGYFLQVVVDGKTVSSENYTVSGEPLAITLNADYLDSLTTGAHTIGIKTKNGTATAGFTVRAASQPTNPTNPKTGDSSHLLLWMVLLAASGAALTGTVIYSRKKKKTN